MSNKVKSGLGRGFDVLMPQGVGDVLNGTDSERIQKVPLESLHPNPDQPRRVFEQVALEQLAESIGNHGVLQPLIVTPDSSQPGSFMIIAGERRWRAAGIAGVAKVPCVVRTEKELQQLEIALVENIQRVDLSPLEQAASISRLHEQFSLSYEQIAKRLGKAVPTISNIVRLLNLTPAAQEALQEHRISEGHARALLALKDYPEQQEDLLLQIQKHGWSVRQAEQYVVATKAAVAAAGQNGEVPPTTAIAEAKTKATNPETEKLSKMLKRPVTISRMAKGGKLAIRFKDDEDLELLLELLRTLKASQ